MFSVQPGLRGSNDLRFGRKLATFQLIFWSREQVVVRRGQIRRIEWVIKTLEAQVGQFLSASPRTRTVKNFSESKKYEKNQSI